MRTVDAIVLGGWMAASTIACGHPTVAAAPAAPSAARLALVVWRIASPSQPTNMTLSTILPDGFEHTVRAMGFTLDVHALTALSFKRAFVEAHAKHNEPDLLVFNNMAIIRGLPERARLQLGPIEGIESDPDLMSSLVNVSESLQGPRRNGWTYLITTSPHHAAALALATRTIDCSHASGAATPPPIDQRLAPARQIAEDAARAYLTQNESTLDALAHGHYPDDTLPFERTWQVLGAEIRPPHRTIIEVKACDAWGNDRLAFVRVVADFESANEVGYRSFVAIIGDVGDGPALVALSGSRELVAALRADVPKLHSASEPKHIDAPSIVNPPDRSSQTRMPPDARPMLEWRHPSNAGACSYLLESQYGEAGTDQPKRWQVDSFFVVPTDREQIRNKVVRLKTPFGAGHQAHRWRIWAIDRDGNFSRSEWRIIFFTT